MDEEIETLVIGVRADTRGFSRDVAKIREELDGPLAQGFDRAGRRLESSLTRALASGRLGFEDLRGIALSVLSDIARSAIQTGLRSILGGGSNGSTGLIGSLLGLPGRATGGPVSAGRGYVVGERGPEMFVPTSAGRVVTAGEGGARDIRITVNVNGGRDASPERMAKSGRQVARAVRNALMDAG